MTPGLEDFCRTFMPPGKVDRRLDPSRLAEEFVRFFDLSGNPRLPELESVLLRAGVGR